MKKIFLLILLCVFPANEKAVFAGEDVISSAFENAASGVEIVLYKQEEQSQLFLRMPENSKKSGQVFEYLANQVEKISSIVGQRTKLPSGYELVFNGGRIYAVAFHQGDQYACLVFSSNIRVDGKTIYFKGEDESSALFDEH